MLKSLAAKPEVESTVPSFVVKEENINFSPRAQFTSDEVNGHSVEDSQSPPQAYLNGDSQLIGAVVHEKLIKQDDKDLVSLPANMETPPVTPPIHSVSSPADAASPSTVVSSAAATAVLTNAPFTAPFTAQTAVECSADNEVLSDNQIGADENSAAESSGNESDDELASRVMRSLSGMQELLDSVEEDLNVIEDCEDIDVPTNSEDVIKTDLKGFEKEEDPQDDIIDLTVCGLKREIIQEEEKELEHSDDEEYEEYDKESYTSNESVQESNLIDIDGSEDQYQQLERQLEIERRELLGEYVRRTPNHEKTTPGEDITNAEEEGSEDSDDGSDDSLHKQVQRSLASSTLSLNQTITGSENGSDFDNSEETSVVTQGMNSRDELEIYDSRDLHNGVHQMMNSGHTLEPKESRSKTPPPGSCVPAMFTINQLKRKFDSVDNIMDRIDAGISTLRKIEMPAKDTSTDDISTSENRDSTREELNVSQKTEEEKTPQLSDTLHQVTAKTYSRSTPNLNSWQPSLSSQNYSRPSFLRDRDDGRDKSDDVILSESEAEDSPAEDCAEDDDFCSLSGGDNHSDLDSDTANATDAKYSEILRNKRSGLGDPRRVSSLRQQDNGADTDSIRTEDFETAFQKSLPADYSLKSLPSHSLAGESTDTPLTEEFEERFRTNLKLQPDSSTNSFRRPPIASGYSSIPVRTNPGSRTSPVNRRHPTSTNRCTPPPLKRTPPKSLGYTGLNNNNIDLDTQLVDTLDELSDMEPEIHHRRRPTSPHHAAPIVPNGYYEADSESEDGDFAEQIREQSNRIQKEIELERRLKSRQAQRVSNQHPPTNEFAASGQTGYNSLDSRQSSLPKYRGSGSYSNLPAAQDIHAFNAYSASTPDMSSLFTAQQASSLMKSQLEEDSNTINRLNDDRMQLIQEVTKLQEQLKRLEDEVGSSELQAKENRARAEESRSHLMVAEFKKEAVLKEISRLTVEVEQGKRIIEEVDQIKEQEDDLLNSLGITMQQIPAMVEERNELKVQVEDLERSGEKEKDDMSKQVQDVKTEASTMQENMQEKVDTLRDSVQRLNAHLERVSVEKDEFKKERDVAIAKCDSLQRDMAAGEHAKAQALEQTIKGYDDMRRRLEKEATEKNTQLSKELKGSKKLLEIEEQKGSKLREEIILRDQLNVSLREQLHDVRQKSIEEEDSHDRLLKELKQQLRVAESEKLAAWDACKQQFEVEKDKLLEATREDLQREHEEMLSALKEEYSRHISQLQHNVKTKESEAHMLRDRLSEQEQESRRMVETLKADIREQIEQAVQNEKKIWVKEQKYQENEQLKQYREKEENQLEQVRFQLEAESRRKEQTEELLGSVRADLEDSKQYSQKLNQEKQAVAQKLKSSEDNVDDELKKLRQELKQHYDKIISSLREDIGERDHELDRLRDENSAVAQSEAESSQALEKFEKMIIHEMNDECKKTADLLGVQPRKAQTVSFSRSSSPSKNRARKRSTSRSLTASAVANLRACNEELRNSLSESKSEVTEFGTAMERLEKAKEMELDKLRNRLNNEKRQEIEDMKTTLAKMPSCRRSLGEPKDPYQVKLERKASEKALRKSLSGSYTQLNETSTEYPSRSSEEPQEPSSAYSMHKVQDRLKHMRAGSPFRYRSNPLLSNSTTDINKYSSAQSLSTAGMDSLEQKVRLAELKARLADERANRNQAMLSQKMHEVNELQHTLNSQTKEIMGLERSYDDFRSSQYSPNRYSALNSTFPH